MHISFRIIGILFFLFMAVFFDFRNSELRFEMTLRKLLSVILVKKDHKFDHYFLIFTIDLRFSLEGHMD